MRKAASRAVFLPTPHEPATRRPPSWCRESHEREALRRLPWTRGQPPAVVPDRGGRRPNPSLRRSRRPRPPKSRGSTRATSTPVSSLGGARASAGVAVGAAVAGDDDHSQRLAPEKNDGVAGRLPPALRSKSPTRSTRQPRSSCRSNANASPDLGRGHREDAGPYEAAMLARPGPSGARAGGSGALVCSRTAKHGLSVRTPQPAAQPRARSDRWMLNREAALVARRTWHGGLARLLARHDDAAAAERSIRGG
jgi:hypothetical protein